MTHKKAATPKIIHTKKLKHPKKLWKPPTTSKFYFLTPITGQLYVYNLNIRVHPNCVGTCTDDGRL